MGAGGATRSVVFALARAGAHVSIWNRTPQRAVDLLAALAPHIPAANADVADDLPAALARADLLVNATSVGMLGGPPGSPLPPELELRPDMTVYDLVYTPSLTPLLRQARAARARAVSGLGMLVRQGAEALTLWTGAEAPVAVMERACQRALRRG
jgi:shikimate dehydrogenase